MAESEGIRETVNQEVVQAGTVVMMAFRDVDTGPKLTPTARQPKGSHRKRDMANQYLKTLIQLEHP